MERLLMAVGRGHPLDRALCTIGCIEKCASGLVLAGNYRGGVGVPDAFWWSRTWCDWHGGGRLCLSGCLSYRSVTVNS